MTIMRPMPSVQKFLFSNTNPPEATGSQAASAEHDDISHIPREDYKKMEESLKKFAQCMSLGRYQDA